LEVLQEDVGNGAIAQIQNDLVFHQPQPQTCFVIVSHTEGDALPQEIPPDQLNEVGENAFL
jgi:hypothetical protein